MRRWCAWAVVASGFVVSMGGCSSCKKKPGDDVSKDEGKKKHGVPEVPMPADLAFEMVLKDPDGTIQRGADAAGHGVEVGPSPYAKALELVPDEEAKKILRALDPHGAVSLVVTAKASALLDVDHWSKDTVQVAFAAHLKDAELARTALDAASKSKGTKSGAAKGFDGRIYEISSDLAVGLTGDIVFAADGADALDKCGRYVSYLADKGNQQEHDLVMRVPMDALEGEVKKSVPLAWTKAKGDVPAAIAAQIDPLVGPLLTAFGEAGDGLAWFDVKANMLVAEQSMSAKGSLSAFFASWPTGDASALLAMPQGDGAALYRWADGLGPLVYASIDYFIADSIKTGDLTAGEGADLQKAYRALGGAIGHEVVYSSHASGMGFGAIAMGTGGIEYVGRIELSDAPTAKASIATIHGIIDTEAKKPPYPVTLVTTPYKKFGAEGETITIPASTSAYSSHAASTVSWAIRGSYLYVDGCMYCAGGLFDDALDPASTKTLTSDSSAKAKIGSFPSKGLVEAGYGDMGAYMKSILAMLGTPSSGGAQPAWGWSTVGADGFHAHEEVPLKALGDIVALYMRTLGGFGYGGYGAYPMGMGTPSMPIGTPPPPPPMPKPPPGKPF